MKNSYVALIFGFEVPSGISQVIFAVVSLDTIAKFWIIRGAEIYRFLEQKT